MPGLPICVSDQIDVPDAMMFSYGAICYRTIVHMHFIPFRLTFRQSLA